MAFDTGENGYPAEIFITPPHDEFLCVICLNVAKEATKCMHEHTFCKACITRWVNRGTGRCPVDRQPLETYLLSPFRTAQNIIGKYCVRCPLNVGQPIESVGEKQKQKQNKKRNITAQAATDCDWTGMLCDLEHHMEICPAKVVKCAHGDCGQLVPACRLADHVKSCRHRLEPCVHCGKVRKPSKRSIHKRRCPKLPVRCPNRPCKEVHLRDQLAAHRSTCQYETVPCSLSAYGECDYTCWRRDMPKHMEDASAHSIDSLVRTAVRQKEKIDSLQAMVTGKRKNG